MIVGTSNHGTLVNLKFALLRPEKGAKERTDGIGNLGKEYAGGIAQPKLSASPKEPFFLVFLKRKLERVPAAGVEERDFDRRSSMFIRVAACTMSSFCSSRRALLLSSRSRMRSRILSLFLRPQDRKQADAPRTYFAHIGASALPLERFIAEFFRRLRVSPRGLIPITPSRIGGYNRANPSESTPPRGSPKHAQSILQSIPLGPKGPSAQSSLDSSVLA
ncbi:hypothetical protein ACFE04_025394 [Oxalis oulophora]